MLKPTPDEMKTLSASEYVAQHGNRAKRRRWAKVVKQRKSRPPRKPHHE